MKSKVLFGLFATLLVLALAPNSFAQIQISIINTASEGEVATSHHAQTSTPGQTAGILVSGTFLAQSSLSTTMLTLTFPAAITSSPAAAQFDPGGGGAGGVPEVPAGDGIRLSSKSGLFASITGIWTIDYEDGEIQILLPSSANNTASGSFIIVGTRIDADDLSGTGPFEVNASLGPGVGYLPNDMDADIITALGAGFTAVIGAAEGSENEGTITIFNTRSVTAGDDATILMTEPFDSAFRSEVQHSQGGTTGEIQGTTFKLTFAGVPAGVTLTVTAEEESGDLVVADPADNTITSTDTEAEFVVTDSDLDDSEEFQFRITATINPTTGPNFAGGNITVAITLAPDGDPLDDDDVPTADGGFPRFEELETTLTVATIVAPTTTLLIPYAVVDNSILYDTGIALANTTEDPFGAGSATAAAGSIRVDVFPRLATGPGTPFGFTTSASERPGAGLSTDGTLAAGSTWTVLVSTIMAQEGVASPMTGYIFLQANFTNAHGITFISDFGAGPFNFTSFSPMLVLPSPTATSRANEVGLNF
jgi:hypothetical protein